MNTYKVESKKRKERKNVWSEGKSNETENTRSVSFFYFIKPNKNHFFAYFVHKFFYYIHLPLFDNFRN